MRIESTSVTSIASDINLLAVQAKFKVRPMLSPVARTYYNRFSARRQTGNGSVNHVYLDSGQDDVFSCSDGLVVPSCWSMNRQMTQQLVRCLTMFSRRVLSFILIEAWQYCSKKYQQLLQLNKLVCSIAAIWMLLYSGDG